MFVSPSYSKFNRIGDPFQKDGKWYVTIDYKGKPKVVRGYESWQKAWGEKPDTTWEDLLKLSGAENGIYLYEAIPPIEKVYQKNVIYFWAFQRYGCPNLPNITPDSDLNPVWYTPSALSIYKDLTEEIRKEEYLKQVQFWECSAKC